MANEDDILSLWQFQSKLMWSRIQTSAVIEAAVIGGWYQTWNTSRSALSIAILLLGAFLLLIVSILMHRDGQYMTAYETIAGNRIPKIKKPFLGIKGHCIAVFIPSFLAIANIVLVFTMNYFA